MRGKRKSKFITALTALLFLLLIAAAIGLIVRFTKVGDKITDMFDTSFRIEYNGITYKSQDNKVGVVNGERVKFTVKGCESYKVQVMPNVTPETDFTYTVNGQKYSYGSENLTGLIIKADDIYSDCFYIDSAKDSIFLQDVLSRVWGGEQVTLNGRVDYPYLITVTSNKGEIIKFAVAFTVTDIELPESIVF